MWAIALNMGLVLWPGSRAGLQGQVLNSMGETYHLEANSVANFNHSGPTGWDGALFSVESVAGSEITLYTERADGTGGFPGNLKVWLTYGLTGRW